VISNKQTLPVLCCSLRARRFFAQLDVELAIFFFPSLAIGHVVVRFQDGKRPALLVSPQRPSACHHDARSVGLRLLQLASHRLLRSNSARTSSIGRGKPVCNSSWLCFPSPALPSTRTTPGSSIPVGDRVTHVADENRVVSQFRRLACWLRTATSFRSSSPDCSSWCSKRRRMALNQVIRSANRTKTT